MKAPQGFKDEPGRAEAAALKRVEKSSHAAWLVNYDSWVPARVQLFFLRLWLWISG